MVNEKIKDSLCNSIIELNKSFIATDVFQTMINWLTRILEHALRQSWE